MSKITNEFRSAALRRGILVKTANGSSELNFAFAAMVELANLGFIVDPKELATVNNKGITDTITAARALMGADRDMTPIYPGFPKQVQELSTMTLLVEQILHYWSGGTFLPNYPTIARDGLPVEDMLRNARELTVKTAAAAADEVIRVLVTDPIALSEGDKEMLTGALELKKPSLELVTEIVKDSRNAENIQTFVIALKNVDTLSARELALAVIGAVRNSDALLRVVLALFTVSSVNTGTRITAGPVVNTRIKNHELAVTTLADRHVRAVRMLNIPREVRFAVVTRLGVMTDGYKADALVTRQNLWRKVMTAVHPYDFSLPVAQKRAADIIHSNVDYRTLNSLIEEAMENKDVKGAVTLLAKNQPGNLLRRIVALLRLVKTTKEAKFLANHVCEVGGSARLTTLVSAYNGVIAANDDAARVTRVAGINNTMVKRDDVVKVNDEHVKMLAKAVKKAIKAHLATKAAPVGAVGIMSTVAVPLVNRDAATADRKLDRGQEIALAGAGDTLRVFTHWTNNQTSGGYMDAGLVILDETCTNLAVLTWDTWSAHRHLGTYSGDKNVNPGHTAAEYFDLDLAKVRAKYPNAIYVAMTIQSWSGWPTSNVDIIAGAMLRSKPDSGEVFDARTINTAFKPTTDSTQSVPLAVDLRTGVMVWVDSSNGSDEAHTSSRTDDSVGAIIYDELERPRLTLGDLAKLWAKAHGAETVDKPVNKKELLALI